MFDRVQGGHLPLSAPLRWAVLGAIWVFLRILPPFLGATHLPNGTQIDRETRMGPKARSPRVGGGVVTPMGTQLGRVPKWDPVWGRTQMEPKSA